MMDKHAVARVLEEIASFLELRGENVFKVRAFQNAARTVETFPGDLDAALGSGELAATKGIGPATLDVVRECLASGRSGALETLRGEVPPGLVEMLRIGGMGVAKVRSVHEALGIATLAELESAARDGRLAKLPRFGEKTAAKVLKGLEFLHRTSAFRLAHHAARQADQLRAILAALPGVARVDVAGSVRRRCEVVRDVDLAVATAAQPRELGERLVRSGAAHSVVAAEPAGVTIRFADGTTADIHCAAPPRYGHALAWATGSAAHLALLGSHAASRGFALDAGGLTRDGAAVPCPDEEAFFETLGLAHIPPELREGADEIARAAAGPLPRLVERSDLRGLLHCHTTYSDGANSVAELAEACGALGYAYVGITDHSEAAAYAGGLSAERVTRQHEEIDAWNRASPGLRILKGIEADILADGTLDYQPGVLDRFDFVIGSVHSRFELDEPTMTERVLRAMADRHLTVLGHPTGRLLLSRDPYSIDLRRVIARAAEAGVAIEINGDPQRLDLDWRLCREARDAGVAISIGTDAHSLAGLANAELGVGIARKGWLEAKDILNTRDAEGFLEHAKARR
jgi:DNA polymerase (family 10)